MINFSHFLLFIILLFSANSCNNDTYCNDCRFYIISISGGGLAGYFACAQCASKRQVDAYSGDCLCKSGYYQKSNGNCSECPSECSQCSSSSNCTECQEGIAREVVKGSCVCMDGYEQAQGSVVCQQKANILMVVLSSIGSILCLIVCSVICVVIRYRRNSRVHTEKKDRHQASNNIEVQVYQQEMDNTSNMFFIPEGQSFKENETCSICLESKPLFMTDCLHYFHGKCIYSWLQNKKTCPNCNKQIKSKDIRRWCEKCKKNIMPVLKNVIVTKVGKKKKQVTKTTPVQHQICDSCEMDTKTDESQQKDAL